MDNKLLLLLSVCAIYAQTFDRVKTRLQLLVPIIWWCVCVNVCYVYRHHLTLPYIFFDRVMSWVVYINLATNSTEYDSLPHTLKIKIFVSA